MRQITFETLIGLSCQYGAPHRRSLTFERWATSIWISTRRTWNPNTRVRQVTRFIPVHPSTTQNLRRYLDERHRIVGDKPEMLLLLRLNKPLRYSIAQHYFEQFPWLWEYPKNPGRRGPAWHSLRHTFAVQRLLTWYRAGSDVRSLLPNLAIYLGHVGPAQTYHYLTATPELLSSAASMFEAMPIRKGTYDATGIRTRRVGPTTSGILHRAPDLASTRQPPNRRWLP